jgi:hypothetical protein
MRASTGVTLLGVFTLLCGLASLLWGAAIMGIGGAGWFFGVISFTSTIATWGAGAFWGGLLGILTGAAQILSGIGVLARRPWAWLLTAVLTVLALVNPVVGILSGNLWGLFGLIVPCVVLYFLMQPEVKREFSNSPLSPPS